VSPARTAATLDPASELEGFQAAASVLIVHGIVTTDYPREGVLPLVRRFEEPLRREFHRLCHWRLDVGPTSARLLRRAAELSTERAARTTTQSKRPFAPQTYASLCIVLAAIERLGEQTSIRRLAEEVALLVAGDDALPFDLTVHHHRRAFVDAVSWLERRGVLRLLDGETEHFLSGAGDALYDIDQDAAGRLLLSPPSVLAGLSRPEDFLVETYPPTAEGAQARARHSVHRRLLTDVVVYYWALEDDERDYARQRRGRIREELERLTGATLECRLEGQALIGLPSAEPFPGTGNVAQAALLLASELVVASVDSSSQAFLGGGQPGEARPGDLLLSADELASAWRRIVASYRQRFSADYRAEPARLLSDAVAMLERLGLARRLEGGAVLLRPAIGRYRSDDRLPEPFDV
jgi:uncharacterized protein (TIGR02678 family)